MYLNVYKPARRSTDPPAAERQTHHFYFHMDPKLSRSLMHSGKYAFNIQLNGKMLEGSLAYFCSFSALIMIHL